MRTKQRKKRAAQTRVPSAAATAANQRWSMDFMSERFENGVFLRVLTIIDQFTRECPLLWADVSLTGIKVVERLERLATVRGLPQSITVDNDAELCSRAIDVWAYQHSVKLDFNPTKQNHARTVSSKASTSASRRVPQCESVFHLADTRQKLEA